MNDSRVEIHRHRPGAGSVWRYEDLDRRQREIRDAVLAGERGRLILSEVAPVISLGMRDSHSDLLLDESVYPSLGISLYRASRGGRATYHGPGQWLAFPVDSLVKLTGDRKGVRRSTELLLEAALEVARFRFPEAEIRSGVEAGVWSGGQSEAGKVAAMGIRFDSGILQHGISLNVHPTAESFRGIRPCGLDAPVAYLGGEGGEREFLSYGERLASTILARMPSLRGNP